MLRGEPGRRPVRPRRCRKDATVRGCTDLDDPVEVADVDAQLERRGRDDDAVARLREGRLRPPPLVGRQRRVATRRSRPTRARSACASDSTVRRESAKTSRFSPRCREAMTVAALSTVPT